MEINMNDYFMLLCISIGIWLAVINIFSAALVMIDKRRSKSPRGSKKRIREKTFVRLSVLGGGFFTLGTMLLIHHKTKSHDALLSKIAFWTLPWAAVILFLLSKVS